jgi:hypothetical protein
MRKVPAASLTASNDSTAKGQPGHLASYEGNIYKYVLIEDMNVANGDVVEYSDTSGYEVTKDRAGGASIGRSVAGVAVGTITDGNYGYILVQGRHTALKTDGGVASGDALVPHATYDGKADTATASSTATNTEAQTFGYALAADSSSASTATVVAMIRCL